MLVLHRSGFDCGYAEAYTDCDLHTQVDFGHLADVKLTSAKRTSLTGVEQLDKLETNQVELNEMDIRTYLLNLK